MLYDLSYRHVTMSCSSRKIGNLTSSGCLSEFASNVALGLCEYCCTTQFCNDDWTVAHIRDDCAEQSAAATVRQCWPLYVAIFITIAVHAALGR